MSEVTVIFALISIWLSILITLVILFGAIVALIKGIKDVSPMKKEKKVRKMSKSLIRKYLFITAIIIAYVVLIIFSISSNKKKLQATTYRAWYRNYVIQSIKGAYVNTGDEDHPTALSERQGYGMVITALAAQKGFASEAQFSRLFNYYKDHTISENIPLMMWKQHETSKGWISVDKNNATDGDLDITYALILAQRLWPNSEYHYGKRQKQY